MKNILLLITLLVSTGAMTAQTKYNTQRDYSELQKIFESNRARTYNPRMLQNMRNFHLTTQQAKELASMLRSDEEKGDFLYQVFPQIIDPENYLEVVDVFRRFSSALKLYHYTLGSYAMLQQYQNVPHGYPQQYHYAPDQVYAPNLCEMPPGAFSKFLTTLDNASFSDTKLNMVKSQVNKACFSTDQISQIMEEFSSDDDRVEVATSLYQDCLDRGNYFTLLDQLSFSDSKDKLSQYISSH